jgi:hypothetical protein
MTAITNAQPQQFQCSAQVNFGLSDQSNSLLLNYQEPNGNTALYQFTQTQFVPANSTNNAYNLASMFAASNTPAVIGWYDASNPGQQMNWGMQSGGSRFDMNLNGFTLLRVTNATATLPTIYVDNPSPGNVGILVFFCISN